MSVVKPPTLQDYIELKGSLEEAIKELLKTNDDYVVSRKYNIPYHLILLVKAGHSIDPNLLFNIVIGYYDNISTLKSIKGKSTEFSTYLNILPTSYEKKIRFILGRLSDTPYGIGEDTLFEALRLATNKSKTEMEKLRQDYGEIGDVATFVVQDKNPSILLDELYYLAKMLPILGSSKKIYALTSLFKKCNKNEAKYICRILRRKLYLGLPTVAIVQKVSEYLKVLSNLLRQACLIRGLLNGLLLARQGNIELSKISLMPSRFIEPQLAYTFDRKRLRYPCRIEGKYDGSRVEVHKLKDQAWVFSRKGILRNNSYPEIVAIAKQLKCSNGIFDGEIIGINSDNKIVSFQELLKRLGKKDYDEITSKDIKLSVRFFDTLYCNGVLIHKPLSHRLRILRQVVPKEYLAIGTRCEDFNQLMTLKDNIISSGFEGIMVKDLQSNYYPTRRHFSWMKLKPDRDTLDVVLTKGKYGKTRYAGWYSSYRLAVRDNTKKVLYEIGDMATLSEDIMGMLTDEANKLVIRKDKEGVMLKPSLVVEVAFSQVMKSDKYSSGYSLRNPTFVRIRTDKDISQIDTLSKLQQLYVTI